MRLLCNAVKLLLTTLPYLWYNKIIKLKKVYREDFI